MIRFVCVLLLTVLAASGQVWTNAPAPTNGTSGVTNGNVAPPVWWQSITFTGDVAGVTSNLQIQGGAVEWSNLSAAVRGAIVSNGSATINGQALTNGAVFTISGGTNSGSGTLTNATGSGLLYLGVSGATVTGGMSSAVATNGQWNAVGLLASGAVQRAGDTMTGALTTPGVLGTSGSTQTLVSAGGGAGGTLRLRGGSDTSQGGPVIVEVGDDSIDSIGYFRVEMPRSLGTLLTVDQYGATFHGLRLTNTLYEGNGSGLTNLNALSLSGGTVTGQVRVNTGTGNALANDYVARFWRNGQGELDVRVMTNANEETSLLFESTAGWWTVGTSNDDFEVTASTGSTGVLYVGQGVRSAAGFQGNASGLTNLPIYATGATVTQTATGTVIAVTGGGSGGSTSGVSQISISLTAPVQIITNGIFTAVRGSNVDINVGSAWNTNTYTAVLPVGTYSAGGQIACAFNSATGTVIASIRRNGSELRRFFRAPSSNTGGGLFAATGAGSCTFTDTAGTNSYDFVRYQDSGFTVTNQSAAILSTFWLLKIAP